MNATNFDIHLCNSNVAEKEGKEIRFELFKKSSCLVHSLSRHAWMIDFALQRSALNILSDSLCALDTRA